MGARYKITDKMVDAAIDVFDKEAMKDGHVAPSEEDAPEMWKRMREVTHKALQAAAAAIETNEGE
jgi:hypothetical protein